MFLGDEKKLHLPFFLFQRGEAFIQTIQPDFQQRNRPYHGANVTENISKASSIWYVYLIRTRHGTLYTGITTDTERRLKEHHAGIRGAKNLRGKGPLELVYHEQFASRSIASVLEARIKKPTRSQKEEFIAGAIHWSQLVTPAQV